MTTEETPQVREIATLLALDTYQGMTDDEIELVIEWHVNDAVQKAMSSETMEGRRAANAEIVSIAQSNANALVEMVQGIVSYVPELEVISND